jgi:hypothetical protein
MQKNTVKCSKTPLLLQSNHFFRHDYFNRPFGINDNGLIIGLAQDPLHWNLGKAYLLTPIPEPCTLVLLALGGMMLRKLKN